MRTRNRLLTDAVREILHTKKKFFSLLIMNFLAVGFLAGLRMTAPDMKHSLDVYYDEQNLMDLRIVSTLGLTDKDLETLREWRGASGLPVISDAEGSKSFDALVEEETVTVFSLPVTINRLRLTDGRLPENSGECVTEQFFLDKLGIGIGDTITIDTKDADKTTTESSVLKEHTFVVVGAAKSPMYITRTRGASRIGSGTVTAWVSIPEDAFTQPYYSAIYLTADELDPLDCYGDSDYEDRTELLSDALEELGRERAAERHEELIRDATITDMFAQILSMGLEAVQIEGGKWYILGRNTLESYEEFAMDAERMSNLADVFPMIFFLVAALSSLTTMTRMVEEHRTEIGGMKALGFTAADIGIKYIGCQSGRRSHRLGVRDPGDPEHHLLRVGPGIYPASDAAPCFRAGPRLFRGLCGPRHCRFGRGRKPVNNERFCCFPDAAQGSKTRQKSAARADPRDLEEALFSAEGKRPEPVPIQKAVLDDGRRDRRVHGSGRNWAGTQGFDLRYSGVAVR